MSFIPIFVVDRPASLEILKGLSEYRDNFGILAHAFTTGNFKKKFREFDLAKYKIGDSGIYQGKEISYEKLFEEYVKMGVTHGIIKDRYRDPVKTYKSARIAIRAYEDLCYDKKFTIVGVAQGNSVAEYLQSYEDQLNLGYPMVAVGGLLTKVENHKRMVKVKKESFLTDVVRAIKESHRHDDIFLLGAFNRSRIGFFKELDIWGADYKGWIFQYNKEQNHRKNDRFEQTRNYIKHEIFPLIQKKRLLILSCTQKKRDTKGPSIEVYDGPSFRVVRKYLELNDRLDIRIISAKYGLINKGYEIRYYDERINEEKAKKFRRRYLREVQILFSCYNDVMVFGNDLYRSVLGKHDAEHPVGRIGEQLSQLKNWLYSKP